MLQDPLSAASTGAGSAHPESYWAATAGAAPPDDGVAPASLDCEVAIIGGGYTGLACAYHLARHYGIKPVVLEAHRPGWGCSGRNGGFARAAIGRFSAGKMIERWGRDTARKVFKQSMAALENVRELVRSGIACDAVDRGHLKLAHRASRIDALKREAETMQREFEYSAEFLPGAEVQSLHIAGTEAFGALRIPDAVALHPLKLAHGVLRLARLSGAKVYQASPVLSLSKQGAEHTLATPHGKLRARTVVLATNGYTPEHLHDCVRARLLPVLSHIIVTRPMSFEQKSACNFVTEHVLTDTRELSFYYRRLPDDRILFGGRGQIDDDAQGHARQRRFLRDTLTGKLPALEGIEVEYDWWGWVCLTRDFVPHVHHAEDDPSVHYAMGYMGSGVSYSLYAGKLLAARIAGEHDADAMSIPSTTTPLPHIPLARLRRIGQRAAYAWMHYRDEHD